MIETFGNIGRRNPDYNDTALLIIREFILIQAANGKRKAEVIRYPT